jgi:hypothetical protein
MAANIEGSCAIDPFKDRPVAQSKRFGREDETSLRLMISSNPTGRARTKDEKQTLMSGGWPMKKERELIKLARKKRSAEQIAKKLDAPLPQIFKVARRLGVDLGPQPLKLDRRLGPRPK